MRPAQQQTIKTNIIGRIEFTEPIPALADINAHPPPFEAEGTT